MRPIERGSAPRTYARYADAIGDLEGRLGRYCSYCERRLPTSLAVEHMAPKNPHQDRELDWSNFLLACVNCNSIKRDKDAAEDDILWPDRHNTMLALAYSRGGFVRVAEGTAPRTGAARTGVDRSRRAGSARRPTRDDSPPSETVDGQTAKRRGQSRRDVATSSSHSTDPWRPAIWC